MSNSTPTGDSLAHRPTQLDTTSKAGEPSADIEAGLVLPDPQPEGTNPFKVISWILFTVHVAARHLTQARERRIEELGRKMRTESQDGVLRLHPEDDVDWQSVERVVDQRTLFSWSQALSDARKLCAEFRIPFDTYDPLLKAASDKMNSLYGIIGGVCEKDERYYGDEIITRLSELADSTTPRRLQVDPIEAPKPSPTSAGDFVERLLAGPDDVELTPRELARLESHLQQPQTMSVIQRERQTQGGRSPTAERRNKLKLIRDFNHRLQHGKNVMAYPTDHREPEPANPVSAAPSLTGTAESEGGKPQTWTEGSERGNPLPAEHKQGSTMSGSPSSGRNSDHWLPPPQQLPTTLRSIYEAAAGPGSIAEAYLSFPEHAELAAEKLRPWESALRAVVDTLHTTLQTHETRLRGQAPDLWAVCDDIHRETLRLRVMISGVLTFLDHPLPVARADGTRLTPEELAAPSRKALAEHRLNGRELCTRLRELTCQAAPTWTDDLPPPTETEKNDSCKPADSPPGGTGSEGGKPATEAARDREDSRHAQLLAAIAKAELTGIEAKVVRIIAEKGGKVPISDAETLCNGDAISAFKRAKPKMKKQGWNLRQHDKHLCAEPLPTRGRK